MPLKDLLRKKQRYEQDHNDSGNHSEALPNASEFTFIRTGTNLQEKLDIPSEQSTQEDQALASSTRRSRLHFGRKSRSKSPDPATTSSNLDGTNEDTSLDTGEKGLSHRLHIHRHSRSRSHSASSSGSVNVPDNLPDIPLTLPNSSNNAANEADEAEWEKRATVLAQANPNSRPASVRSGRSSNATSTLPTATHVNQAPQRPTPNYSRPTAHIRTLSDAHDDTSIQEAIRLHEAGDLERSTAMFGRLADPNGAANALSQVLYGLALRHGWGVEADPAKGMTYLSYAAANSAAIEKLALEAGKKNGGAAKGELVLALFELGNSFRNGWGVAKDPVAARTYYETAANLGDTDAMNEAAACYLQGIGCKKDKFKAALYLRRAEQAGSKTLGNSWIWKEKYDPPAAPS